MDKVWVLLEDHLIHGKAAVIGVYLTAELAQAKGERIAQPEKNIRWQWNDTHTACFADTKSIDLWLDVMQMSVITEEREDTD